MTPGTKIIRVEDHRYLNHRTDEGRAQLQMFAFWAHLRDSSLNHFIFTENDQTVGEYILPPDRDELQ